MTRQRLIRDEPRLPGHAVLVRALFDLRTIGQTFDRSTLVSDATLNFDLFGYFGLSLWAVSDAWPMDRVLAEKCRKARRVCLFSAGDLAAHGLELLASGRTPHYDATVQVTAPSAEELVDRFLSATYTVVDNHLFEPDPS